MILVLHFQSPNNSEVPKEEYYGVICSVNMKQIIAYQELETKRILLKKKTVPNDSNYRSNNYPDLLFIKVITEMEAT